MPEFILAIDPGNKLSAFCLTRADSLEPLAFGKDDNITLYECMEVAMQAYSCKPDNTDIVIENMESFGMPVGRSVLDTCIFIGELKKWFEMADYEIHFIFRHEERMTICHNPRANDASIKQALVDRFATNTSNHGKGTKKEPGWFYGMKADCWSAYAQAVTYHDMYLVGEDTLHLDELPL